jgi:NADPH:quinone reductase-like Zn-dependent oxidoreductase
MKAVVLHEYGGPEKLKFEDKVPDPQVSGDTVLIAAAAASVNPIDWKVRSGTRQKDFPLSFPAILGRDVSGVVRAVGANVKHFSPVTAYLRCRMRRMPNWWQCPIRT